MWLYEACRLFRDKLAEPADIEKFDSIILSVLHTDWNTDLHDSITDVYYVTAALGVREIFQCPKHKFIMLNT